jgi:hypothetical protein
MKSYEKMFERQEEASELAKALTAKALERSKAFCDGEANHAFALGYIESALARVAAMSPSALKELKGML